MLEYGRIGLTVSTWRAVAMQSLALWQSPRASSTLPKLYLLHKRLQVSRQISLSHYLNSVHRELKDVFWGKVMMALSVKHQVNNIVIRNIICSNFDNTNTILLFYLVFLSEGDLTTWQVNSATALALQLTMSNFDCFMWATFSTFISLHES